MEERLTSEAAAMKKLLTSEAAAMEKRLTSKMDKQLRVATGTFEALVRSQPDISGPTVVRDLQQLAWLLGLPTQDLRPAYEALAQVRCRLLACGPGAVRTPVLAVRSPCGLQAPHCLQALH